MNRRGFTLVELLVMMVVLGLLIGVAVPNVTGIVATQKANSFKDDAVKLINDAKVIVTTEKMSKPADGESLVFTLDYLDASNQIKKGPYGGEYSRNDSYVIYKRDGNQYTYYVRLVEVTSKGNYGINLATLDQLTGDDASKLIIEIETSEPINDGSSIDSLSTNTVLSSICPEGSIRRLNGQEQKTKYSKPNTFATDSWVTILYNLRGNNVNAYEVGDRRQIELTGLGTHSIRIANISPCGSTQSQTACGIVLEFTDTIIAKSMNSTDTNVNGWKDSAIRSYVNNTIYNALPSEIKSSIIDTTVVTGHGSAASSNVTTTDKLYLLSPKEVLGDSGADYDTAKNATRQLDFYKGRLSSQTNYYASRKSGAFDLWWLRTPYSSTTNKFIYITGSGQSSSRYASYAGGVSPAFRIG